MRKLMIAASAAALLSTASLAYAAEATGTITAIDPTAGTITLDNGNTYNLSATVAGGAWKVGDKVMVTFDEADGKMNVTAVAPAS